MKTKSEMFLNALALAGMGIFWVLRAAFKAVGYITKRCISMLDLLLPERKMEVALLEKMSLGKGVKPIANREFEATTILAQPNRFSEEFVAADRIVAIRLEPPVAVLHLRVYYAQKVVKREMIVTEQRLRGLLQGRRHTLADAVYDSEKGLSEIKDETVRMAQDLINQKGNLKVKSMQGSKDAAPKASQQSEVKPQVKAESKAVQVPVPKPVAVEAKPAFVPVPQKQSLPSTKNFVPQTGAAVTFEGQLVTAGSQKYTPPGRLPYETFEAKIRMENGVDVPLRGAELERELERNNVRLGDRVAITPLGKVPVTLPSGLEGSKNMYRVTRL